jgi:hypothetical protein
MAWVIEVAARVVDLERDHQDIDRGHVARNLSDNAEMSQ